MPTLPLYFTTDLRIIEASANNQPLMQRAGLASAELAATICADRSAPILILAGPGNNGGDAFVAAQRLGELFFKTCVVFPGNEERLPHDAAQAFRDFCAAGGTVCREIPNTSRWSLIIDGLFGIGLTREIAGPYADLILQANALAARDHCPMLALDCPSGLDADTGSAQATTIRASHTITFIGRKPGLYTANGPDVCGAISVAALALDTATFPEASGHIVDRKLFSGHLKARQNNSHKGTYGNAGILGGASSMVGAALLAARAALRLGSGRVYAGLIDEDAPSFDPFQPELMLRGAEQLLATELSVLACGPGLGTSPLALHLIGKTAPLDIPLVLDADALNLLAGNNALQDLIPKRTASTVLTPHPAEAARLLACEVKTIQKDRRLAAQQLAVKFNAHVALKGCGTVIASPSGHWFINTTGNPGLATAGSGDVLTGLVTALLAQGWPASDALVAAVHLHGEAADRLVNQGIGPIGLTAGELIDSARFCFNQWIYNA